MSPSVWRVWIEIEWEVIYKIISESSPSVWRVWIEIARFPLL